MTAPRPSEADVEALAKVLSNAYDDALEAPVRTKFGQVIPTSKEYARAILASDWLASRDAEHEREVVGAAAIGRVLDLDGQVQQARLRAEAAERALADLRSRLRAYVASIDAVHADESRDLESLGHYGVAYRECAADLRALLPRDDAADDGSPS